MLGGHLAMLGFSALVAGSFALGALAANLIDPAALTAVRFVLAASVIGLVLTLARRLSRSVAAAPWRFLLLGGVFGAYFVLMFEGLKTAAPVSAAAVFTLTPMMSAGFGWLLLRQVTTARTGLALLIGAAGAIWVIFRGDIAAMRAFEVGRGEAIYFLGCVLHALYTPLARRLSRGEGPANFSLGVLVGGALVVGAWGREALLATDWAALPGIVWITLAYLAVFASAASIVLLQFATLRLPSGKVMAYTYLVPSWVGLWQVALGQPAPPLPVLAGVLLTALALVMLVRDDLPPAARAA